MQFQQIEAALLDAMRSRDEAKLNAMLGDDFDMIVAQDPGNPVIREDFIDEIKAKPIGAYAIQGMQVRDVAGQMLATFVLQPKGAGQPVFVVDLWAKDAAANWRLLVRTASLATGSRKAIPGDRKQLILPKKI